MIKEIFLRETAKRFFQSLPPYTVVSVMLYDDVHYVFFVVFVHKNLSARSFAPLCTLFDGAYCF
jgi:hypothetical protein